MNRFGGTDDMKTNDFIKNILTVKDSLPRKQREFCDFLLENYHSIGLDSVSVIAKKASVGTTTVLRTISALGYNDFKDFKQSIHDCLLDLRTPTWWHFKNKDENLKSNPLTIQETWEEINYLQKLTLNENLISNIEGAVDIILKANVVNVLGLRTSKVAAILFENLINQFYPKVNQLSYDTHFVFDKIYHFNKGDILVVFALSPFTKMTLEAAKYCSDLGHPIILITDHNSSSIIPYADVVLQLLSNRNQYTMVPVISLIETLTIALGQKTADKSKKTLDDIGKLLVDKDIITL